MQPPARLLDAGPRFRKAPKARSIARHHLMVALAKWLLPALALLLLLSVVLWPEYARVMEQGRVAFGRVFAIDPESGRMLKPHYRGVDQRGRPYTFTASAAQQTGPEQVVLTDPKGDIVTESGTWVMVQARAGVYMQHQSLLDLSHDVVLYREDGTTLRTQSAEMDVKAGAAAGSEQTHAEGPFGVLDAQGFTLMDKGAVIQFQGPSHLVMNGGRSP